MGRLTEIAGLILIFLLCKAESCRNTGEQAGTEEKVIENLKNGIKETFTSSYLDESQLAEKENLAVQKLKDLSGFLQIMANPALPEALRKEVIAMFLNEFLSADNLITIPFEEAAKSRTLKISQVIGLAEKKDLSIGSFSYDSIQIYQPFQRTGPSSYRGILKCIQKSPDYHDGNPVLPAVRREADVHILRKNKVFGNDTLNVWTLCLGDIR